MQTSSVMNLSRWVAFSILLTSLWCCWAPTGATTGEDGEYGSLSVASANSSAMLTRLCDYVIDEPLCMDPSQQMAFLELHEFLKSILPLPAFPTPGDYLDFAEGRGDRYELIATLISLDDPLFAWTPVVIPDDVRSSLEAEFSP